MVYYTTLLVHAAREKHGMVLRPFSSIGFSSFPFY